MTEKTLENFVYGCDDKLEDGMAGKYIIYVDGNNVRLRVCPKTANLRNPSEYLCDLGEMHVEKAWKQYRTQQVDLRVLGVERFLRTYEGDGYHAGARFKPGCTRVEDYQVLGGSRYVIVDGQFFGAYEEYAGSKMYGQIPQGRALTARCVETAGLRDGWTVHENASISNRVRVAQLEQRLVQEITRRDPPAEGALMSTPLVRYRSMTPLTVIASDYDNATGQKQMWIATPAGYCLRPHDPIVDVLLHNAQEYWDSKRVALRVEETPGSVRVVGKYATDSDRENPHKKGEEIVIEVPKAELLPYTT